MNNQSMSVFIHIIIYFIIPHSEHIGSPYITDLGNIIPIRHYWRFFRVKLPPPITCITSVNLGFTELTVGLGV